MLKQIRIRNKLLIGYSFVLILSISLGSSFIYYFVRERFKENLKHELHTTTTTILRLVQTSVAVSIKNHLRAVSEKNLEIIHYFYERQQQGLLPMDDAQRMAADILLSQTIGESGYIYCMDSLGNVTVHPEAALVATNVSDFAFVREQLARKQGYIEYDWKNPGETDSRPKALYMLYFEPWDWIVSASSYRNEFMSLVNVADFEESVLQLRFGETGYCFVIDGDGNAIVHPKLQGVNIFDAEALPNQYLLEMQEKKSGEIVYPWRNPDEPAPRAKLVIFNHIPEFDWIVASSGYLDEFDRPLKTIRNMIIATAGLSFLLVLPLSFTISNSITTPLYNLMQNFRQMMAGDFSSRMVPDSDDEIGQLASYYNRFADRIEHYRNDLNRQMEQRRSVEAALRESEARYRLLMEAAPDPIVVYDMLGRVTYFNPAFTRIFGWSLDAHVGKKLDHYVPEANWGETQRMISHTQAGERFLSVPSRRYTKDGDLVEVSISGAVYRNPQGNPEGSIIILRDVTKSHRLQQQVMEIGDRVRHRIGQDLHDDLCPHLIGIQGLGTVLAENLEESRSTHLALASKIVELMGSAIDKARTLSRGLCPVYLVAHGFMAALEDLVVQTDAAFSVVCRLEGDAVVVADNTVATHLYYIVQEAVQNAVKHAHADHITISVAQGKEKIQLHVMDDGRGIPADFQSSGIGLQIMQYRAKIINAEYRIASDAGSGTTIHVSVKQQPDQTATS